MATSKSKKWKELELKALTGADDGELIYDIGTGLRGKVYATRSGVTVSFRYRYRYNGKHVDIRCGTWPQTSLSEIRKIRSEAYAQRRNGIDPALARAHECMEQVRAQQAKRSELDALAGRCTVRALFEDWHRKEASKRKDGGAEIRRAFEKDVLPTLGQFAAEDVKRRQVMGVLDKVMERGVGRYANILLQYLRQMFTFAVRREIVENDPTYGLRKKDVGGRENERDRVLSEAELRELAAKLPDSGLTTTAQAAFWIMLSTLCRVGELSKARWQDVDLASGTWRVPAENAKNARPHLIHLSEFARDQFQPLRDPAASETWVIPNRTGTGHIYVKALGKQYRDRQRTVRLRGRSKGIGTLVLKAGVWKAHDLRRSGATLMGELGIRPDVIDRCQNHIEAKKVRRTYQRQELMADRKEAFERLGDRLMMLASAANGTVVAGHFGQTLEAIA